jgi:hypothetical protein
MQVAYKRIICELHTGTDSLHKAGVRSCHNHYHMTHSAGTKDKSMSEVRFVHTWLGSIFGAEVSIGIEGFRVVINIGVMIDPP